MTRFARLRRRSTLAAGAALLCAGLLLASARAAGGERVRVVHISRHRFVPGEVEVARGTTVRWVNDDDDPHTVTADGGAFASAGLDTHEEYTFTFGAAGLFSYHCALHPMMTGRIVVE